MKRLFQRILSKPVLWLAAKFTARPNQERVHASLSKLFRHCREEPGKKSITFNINANDARFIIFSDQHKGIRNGSDDFTAAEPNYLAALNHYLENNFHLISLGDEEELWENTLTPVNRKNQKSIRIQKSFFNTNRFTKVFGNHDIYWNNDPFAPKRLKKMYGEDAKVYEAVLLNITIGENILPILLTHGHQGDGQSDGNWFSAWFVSRVWGPLQSWLHINPNTPAVNDALKTVHNNFMYNWSVQDNNPVLITGHTHQPVFASLTHLESLYKKLKKAAQQNDITAIETLQNEISVKEQDYNSVAENLHNIKPCYFNTGCCCFSDGDITGIEIADGNIRLIKWHLQQNSSQRILLEEMPLTALL